jgi:hypothetical protein
MPSKLEVERILLSTKRTDAAMFSRVEESISRVTELEDLQFANEANIT